MQRERPLTLVGMIRRNLFRQPMRTMLTSLGVSVGVMAIVAFGAIARGLYASTQATIRFSRGDMMVFQAGIAADVFSSLDEEKTRDALLADPGVERVIASLWHVMPVERTPFCLLLGMYPDDVRDHAQWIVEGRNIENDREVILGRITARTLGKTIGNLVYLAGRRFDVAGIYETDVVFFDSAIVVPIRALQDICLRKGQVTNFQVRCRAGADPQTVADRLERSIKGIAAIVTADQYRKIDQGLVIAQSSVGVISFLALVIGGVIVTNTMWMAVHERTREIGVLRALGWSRRRIVGMVMLETTGVGLLAFILGSGFGVALAEATRFLPLAEQFVDPIFDAQPFGVALAVAVLLSVVGGSIPGWRAARISPVEALRYE